MHKKSKSKARGKRKGRGGDGDNVSPVQALSDEYRIQFAELVFQLRGERMLNSESKLIVVNSAIENLLPLVPELVPGSVLAKVDKHPPRARTTRQLGATVRKLLRVCRRIVDSTPAGTDEGRSLAKAHKKLRAAIRQLLGIERALAKSRRRKKRRTSSE
jgi:hypothetical protein